MCIIFLPFHTVHGSWWWTGKSGLLQSMGSQRVRHDWMTELNWTAAVAFGEAELKNTLKRSYTKMKWYLLWDFSAFANQFSSVIQLCPTLCDPIDCSTTGLPDPDHHQFPEFTQTHVHWVSDAIQPPHPLSSPSPPAFNLSQHQGLFKWVSSSHQVAQVLEFQLQHQSFQWIFRTNFL